MSNLRTPATTARLRGSTVSADEAQQIDWDARLGSDQFPQTKPASLLAAYGLTRGLVQPTSAAASDPVSDAKLDKKPCLNLPSETSTPLPDPPQAQVILTAQDVAIPKQKSAPNAADSGEIAAVASPAAPVRQFVDPPATTAPKSSLSRKRSRTPDTKSFATDLLAILSSLIPGRDVTTSAHALFACGITSTSSFAELLVVDADVANVYLDFVGKRMDLNAFEVAWTKKALDAARRSIVRMV
ncbi:Transketolase [Rhodotorula toruloides]